MGIFCNLGGQLETPGLVSLNIPLLTYLPKVVSGVSTANRRIPEG